jgi:hypothetical protein
MHVLSPALASVAVVLVLGVASVAWGQVRTSGSYQLERDSLNTGGLLGTSTNFALQDTVGDVATGRGTSTNFLLQAGFQQQEEVTLSLTAGPNVLMDGNIGGVTGGESNGSTTVNASTNGAAGYQLTIQASAAPAMRTATTTIADYTPAGAEADVAFTTDPGEAHFAFSPFGSDIVDRYRTNGAVCGSGSPSTTACWDGLTTSPVQIVAAAGANTPLGATTTIYFKVGLAPNVTQPAGTYVATTTVTLLSL